MPLHTFKARSMQEALRLVREELGPDASVLHTRAVGSPLSRWLGAPGIEVTASAEIDAPSRWADAMRSEPAASEDGWTRETDFTADGIPGAELHDYRRSIREGLISNANYEPSLVEQLASPLADRRHSGGFAVLRRQLARAGVSESTARRWLDRLEAEFTCDPDRHPAAATDRLRHIVQSELPICGPIKLSVEGQTTVVALVGPTGVGKTTTLAKLAADFRLRAGRSVAVIAADTYRIGASEQLRTYARIMDVPIEVVATPGEMGAAIKRLDGNDLVLVDTAGASAHDNARLQELRALLAEAQPHEVHLVLSCVLDAEALRTTARAFAAAGASSLILTKLDEAAKLGQLPEWLASCRLPLSYLTDGQNVPNDIQPASAVQLAERIVGLGVSGE